MMKQYLHFLYLSVCYFAEAQNVGIGTITPAGKLHVKGGADTSQLMIDRIPYKPICTLNKTKNGRRDGSMHIHSDNTAYIHGVNAGVLNNAAAGGLNNTFNR